MRNKLSEVACSMGPWTMTRSVAMDEGSETVQLRCPPSLEDAQAVWGRLDHVRGDLLLFLQLRMLDDSVDQILYLTIQPKMPQQINRTML